LIEYLRNDEAAVFAGLTISQTISVFLLLSGLAYWAWLGTKPDRGQAPGTSPSAPREAEPAAAKVSNRSR
jgi:hypothetical protein